MPYTKPTKAFARLRSRQALEAAMRVRDLNGAELGALTDIHRQTISNLRRGASAAIRISAAEAIERALRTERGALFDYADAGRRVAAP